MVNELRLSETPVDSNLLVPRIPKVVSGTPSRSILKTELAQATTILLSAVKAASKTLDGPEKLRSSLVPPSREVSKAPVDKKRVIMIRSSLLPNTRIRPWASTNTFKARSMLVLRLKVLTPEFPNPESRLPIVDAPTD
jgi:hypothetical protein